MKNLSRYPNYKKGKCYSEIIDTEIVPRHTEYHLPRHISSLEIKSCRGKLNLIACKPMVCNVDTDRDRTTNLAVDILKYQLGDRLSKQMENTHPNLERPLQIATPKKRSASAYFRRI